MNQVQRFLENKSQPSVQFIKYAMVGVVGTGIHFLIFLTLNETLLPADLSPEGAQRGWNFFWSFTIAFILANLVGYTLNRRWVFQPGQHSQFKEISLFFLFSWVPPEDKDPIVVHAPTRKSVTCFGAVSLSTGKFVRSVSVTFNAQTFELFLQKLLRHRSRGKKMVIVLDNARYHHAKLLAPLLQKYRSNLVLLFLPPYSPELAPIERVWKLARRLATHNSYFATLDAVLIAVETCFDQWAKPNTALQRLCGII